MRIISTVLIVIGILFGLFGVWTFWREYGFERARVVTKGTVSSVRTEPVRNGLTNILYTITFLRDGATDSIEHKLTEQWTDSNPLPTLEQLQAQTFFIHYVPKEKRSKTVYPKRVMVLDSEDYPRFYYPTAFGQMFTFILIGFMVRLFFPKKRVQRLA
jgi:hypothetical protein